MPTLKHLIEELKKQETVSVLDIVSSAPPKVTFAKHDCSLSSLIFARFNLQSIFLDFKSSDGKTLIPSLAIRSAFSSKVASRRFRARSASNSFRST